MYSPCVSAATPFSSFPQAHNLQMSVYSKQNQQFSPLQTRGEKGGESASGVNVTIKARTRETTRKNYTQDISNRNMTNKRTRASPQGKLDKVLRNLDPAKKVRF